MQKREITELFNKQMTLQNDRQPGTVNIRFKRELASTNFELNYHSYADSTRLHHFNDETDRKEIAMRQ